MYLNLMALTGMVVGFDFARAHDGGLTQLKLWNRFDGETGRKPCAPTMLIHQLRCDTPLPYIKGFGDITMLISVAFSLNWVRVVSKMLTLQGFRYYLHYGLNVEPLKNNE